MSEAKSIETVVIRNGYDRLWLWFSLSYSSWLTLPRVMMHEMPDEWQDKMAALMEEWNETYDSHEMPSTIVIARKENRFTKWPSWVMNYRHPDKNAIAAMKRSDS